MANINRAEYPHGYEITPAQFIEDDYAGKIARGEVEVYEMKDKPASNKTNEIYRQITVRQQGNATQITGARPHGQDTVWLEGREAPIHRTMHPENMPLFVIPRERG